MSSPGVLRRRLLALSLFTVAPKVQAATLTNVVVCEKYLPLYLRNAASVEVQIICTLSRTCCSCLIILGYLGEEIWMGRGLIDHEA